jgi:gamma-D-glutamyl-L-lysine dipeptidyl-peptidase
MDFGISLLSILPVRSEPGHRAEMVTQILFGELFRILEQQGLWIRIQLSYDMYEGWIDSRQATLLDEAEFIRLLNAESPTTLDLVQLISNDTKKTILPLILGSSLPGLTGQHLTISEQHFTFDGLITSISLVESAHSPQEKRVAKQKIVEDSMLFLNAPYLWGGRSPFGIDCSGFTQMIYKLSRIKLLRDAVQQASYGESLNFVSESEPGDLAFFDNEDGAITHVGLIMDKTRIIHASGKVRIDTIDHQGIYNLEEKRYTHKLRVIKRVI